MLHSWGQDKQGREVFIHTLRNTQGMEVSVSNFGAIIQQIRVPSKKFGLIDTVLSYPRLEHYLADGFYIGTVCGRYCNRIANAEFMLNGSGIKLSKNEGRHHLHGGVDGFSKRTWTILAASETHFQLELISPDGDQGYPGKLSVVAEYHLDEDNSLSFSWRALSDQDTPVNLTNHSYFNLAGYGDIKNHFLKIVCDTYTPVDDELIPLGNVQSVRGSAFDFRKGKMLDDVLSNLPLDFEATGGLDHNWGCAGQVNSPEEVRTDQNAQLLAELYCSESGLGLAVLSTLPGLQCYTGNHLGFSSVFGSHEGICLESQFYPDSPNQPNFPSTILTAGATIEHKTIYRFSDGND